MAGLLVSEMLESEKPSLLIDIGTNCEVVVSDGKRIVATSAPAGPAFEGACIEFGIRAEPGAIHDARFDNGELKLETIEGRTPRGICGSGLVHLIAELNKAGVILPSGIFADQANDLNIEVDECGGKRYCLHLGENDSGVWLTQRDIREFQLARAAIVSAWKMLCEELRMEESTIDNVYIAGAFGNYIRPDAAKSLGLIPNINETGLHSIGNAALEGARLALLNRKYWNHAAEITDRVEFVELAGRDDFQEVFALELSFAGSSG